jgi:hypothetical protein
MGSQSHAQGESAIAVGNQANAIGDTALAVGSGANATHENSAAFGAGATTTRDNQQMFGTASNTYTMAGLTSQDSRDAQGAPTALVTTNDAGDLAAHTAAELGLATQSQIDALGRRDDELTEGIAIALALQQPMFQPGQTFAVRVGWGNFDGENAVGATAAGLLVKGAFGPGSTVVLDGGVGTGANYGNVAARGGLTFGW